MPRSEMGGAFLMLLIVQYASSSVSDHGDYKIADW